MYDKYVVEENLYLVTSKAVARTSIFNSRHYCERFLYQLRRYIGPLGSILGYSLVDDEFSFIIRLASRKEFEEYHSRRQAYEGKSFSDIPDSTYIFSQAMANLLTSTVMHFNKREDRSGALFATRFKKRNIRDGAELSVVLERLWQGIQTRVYRRKWRDPRFDGRIARSSWYYNFRGLISESQDLAFLRDVGMGLGMRMLMWMAVIRDGLQARPKNSYFSTKIPFNLPFLNPPEPP